MHELKVHAYSYIRSYIICCACSVIVYNNNYRLTSYMKCIANYILVSYGI